MTAPGSLLGREFGPYRIVSPLGAGGMGEVAAGERQIDVLALDEALESLSKFDPRKSRVVELRYFGGLSVEETAEALEISPETAKRDWKTAKTWLFGELTREKDRVTSP